MAEDKQALLRHYRQTREDLLAAIAGLSDSQITEPSIDGWSVKDHLEHIAFWDEIRAVEVARISAGHGSAWRMTHDQDAALNQMGYELRHGLSVEQATWELAESRRRLLDAISSATPRGLDASLYGESALVSSHEAEHTEWIRRWRKEKGF
jgi:uncharacterized damage-inducible protein DinB